MTLFVTALYLSHTMVCMERVDQLTLLTHHRGKEKSITLTPDLYNQCTTLKNMLHDTVSAEPIITIPDTVPSTGLSRCVTLLQKLATNRKRFWKQHDHDVICEGIPKYDYLKTIPHRYIRRLRDILIASNFLDCPTVQEHITQCIGADILSRLECAIQQPESFKKMIRPLLREKSKRFPRELENAIAQDVVYHGTRQGIKFGAQSLAYSPYGNQLALNDHPYGGIVIWTLPSDINRVKTIANHYRATQTIVWMSDNCIAASDGLNLYMTKRAGKDWTWLTKTLEGAPASSPIAWNSDSNQLAFTYDDKIFLWSKNTGEHHHAFSSEVGSAKAIAWKPKSTLLVTTHEAGRVCIWDVEKKECTQKLRSNTGRMNSAAWRADGKQLAVGSADNAIHVWNTDSSTCTQASKWEGHTGSVSIVVYRPDGEQLASGSDDSTVRLWDPKTGKCLHVLFNHSGPVNAVAYSHDSTKLASASNNESIELELLPKKFLTQANLYTSLLYVLGYNARDNGKRKVINVLEFPDLCKAWQNAVSSQDLEIQEIFTTLWKKLPS